MKTLLAAAGAMVFAFSQVVAERPNVLFIAVDDLRDDIGAMGAASAKTPSLDAFAKTARVFTRHYVQAPTCGASRCALLRGRYPDRPVHLSNEAILKSHAEWAADSLPALFRKQGYRTLSLGKITHYPGGLTGKNWARPPEELPGAWDRSWVPESPWKTPREMMHGYANGRGRKPGTSPAWEAHEGPDESYPDAWVAKDAVATLKELSSSGQPWFFAVGFFKPHLPFAAPARWFDLHAAGIPAPDPSVLGKPDWPSGWHASGELLGTYAGPAAVDAEFAATLRRANAACVSYMDAQVGRVMEALRTCGLEKNTIVVLWGDHGYLLGEHAIWGKHCLFERAVRSPLMIRSPGMRRPGDSCPAVVETVDIASTLLELCALPAPARSDGRSLLPQLLDPSAESSKPALSFWGGRRSVRDSRWRLIRRETPEGPKDIELFDYQNDPHESRNHAAEQPETVARLGRLLDRAPLGAR